MRRVVGLPLMGAVLALGAPLGLLALRIARSGSWSLREAAALVTADLETFVYLTCSTTTVFVILGIALGIAIDRLRRASITDPLTGLFNRRYFEPRVDAEIEHALRHGLPLSVLMIDLDHLKQINDGHGHVAGDVALVALAEAIDQNLRSSDLAGRLGGDEFSVLLRHTTAAGAAAFGRRVQAALKERNGALSVSIGVAELDRTGIPRTMLLDADDALRAAKSGGRDRIVVADPLKARTIVEEESSNEADFRELRGSRAHPAQAHL